MTKFKNQISQLPISDLLISFAYLLPFSTYSRKFDLSAMETPPVVVNDSIGKTDFNVLCMVC